MDGLPIDEAELETLRKGARGAGLLVALSDRSFFDTFKEAGAMGKVLAEAQQRAASPLLREVAGGSAREGFGLTDRQDEIERETADALRESRSILEAKAPGEWAGYRELVLEIARRVSEAAGGGEEAEAAAIARIEAALG